MVKSFFFASVTFIVGASSLAKADSIRASDDLHRRLSRPEMSQPSVISKFSLVRLWPLDRVQGFQEDLVLNQREGIYQTSQLINKTYNVGPRRCGGKTFVHFDRGAIISDESLVVQNILTEAKPTSSEVNSLKFLKGWDFLNKQYPNFIPKRGTALNSPDVRQQETLKKAALREEISRSTSFVEVKDDLNGGRSYVNSIDYTVGGWFKPTNTAEGGQETMPLFTKKLKNRNGEEVGEWSLFVAGNRIYFHNFRDWEKPSTLKYLSKQEAALFRSQHSDFYGATEYYADVEARPVVNEVSKSEEIVTLNRNFTAPPTLPRGKKPTVPPQQPIFPPPPYVPPVIPRPPGSIPTPVPVPLPIGTGDGKEYTLNFDMKSFWWASSLGSCYECVSNGAKENPQLISVHQDAWNYFSISVHQNDPLGPYVDLMIIQDPMPKIFGDVASFKRNVRHARFELDPRMLSKHPNNPFESTATLEKTCEGDISCVSSVLELGGIGTDSGYRGYMRGVFIARKALKNSEMLEMASQYYPADYEQCTYENQKR